jgi:hypothetical protein
MDWFYRTYSRCLTDVLAAGVVIATLAAGGCWDDECSPPCEEGFACYYGACLSRGFCPANDDHADTCARYSDTGECLQRVDHGICDRGWVCECQNFNAEGRCTERECVRSTEED